MKYTLGFLCIILFSCTSNKSDEVLIKDLKRATSIIEDKNLSTVVKVRKYYLKDTSDLTGKSLYEKLELIQKHKASYHNNILNKKDTDIEQANAEFVKACIALLSEEEKEEILKEMKDSPLFDSGLLQEIDESSIFPYELALEAEIFTQEVYKVLLKDFTKAISKTKNKLEWDVIYGEK